MWANSEFSVDLVTFILKKFLMKNFFLGSVVILYEWEILDNKNDIAFQD